MMCFIVTIPNTSFSHFGVSSNFSIVDGQYTVRTDNADGEMQDFVIAYTFGFYPLQQYLIAFEDGRYQALNVAWDSRPAAQGGQRWIHLYADKGFQQSLADGGVWPAAENRPSMKNSSEQRPQRQLAACGACHSRRQEIAHPASGADFLDNYTPSLLREGMYFPDGQIEDEVYVYGSFLQSKMHAAGVVCSNCHEPHSLKLRAEGNALCSQCHAAASFDTPAHHHHKTGDSGAQCVNCHMPKRNYMVVDPRRDHSFRIPQPILSGLLNTPNACTGCHQDKDNAWAKQALQNWLDELKALIQAISHRVARFLEKRGFLERDADDCRDAGGRAPRVGALGDAWNSCREQLSGAGAG